MNLPKDRIAQGRFFLQKAKEVGTSNLDAFRYFIEAAIIAARSVTFLLQKQYRHVHGFEQWYSSVQNRLADDSLARFILEKRNFVLKEGIASIRKVVNLNIHETVHIEDSVSVKVIRGSLKSRLRHLPEDLVYPIRERWAKIKRRYCKRRIKPNQSSSTISEEFYFTEPEWATTPASELLKRLFDNLESIMNDAVNKFGEGSNGTNGS